MLRFLRRYNRVLLVVGGSFLMVIFLLPMTPRLGPDPSAQVVARVDGDPVTVGDLRRAVDDLSVVFAVAPEIYITLGLDDKRPEHWLLLVREARQAGLVGGVRDGRSFVEEAARVGYELGMIDAYRNNDFQTLSEMQQDRAGWISQRIARAESDRLRAAMRLRSEREVDLALARVRGVIRLIEANNTAAIYSTREALELARRVSDVATIGVVIVPGSTGAPSDAQPDEAALLAQFEKYKAVRPEPDPRTRSADNPLGFGYLQPPAVKVQRISIDRARLMSAYQPDPIEINKFWQQNRARYPGEFAVERPRVENDYKSQRVSAILDRAADTMRRELFRATNALAADPDSRTYKVLPPDWPQRMPPLQSLADALGADLSREYSLADFKPEVFASDDGWKTISEMRALPGIGRATLKVNETQAIAFYDLAMTVKELGGNPRFGVQRWMVSPPLRELNGSLHYFRVLDVRPQGPPASIEEVRAQVLADVRLVQGMERLESEVDAYRRRALESGLQGLANDVGAPVQWGLEVTPRVVRTGSAGTEDTRLSVPEFRDAVIEAARRLDPTIPAEDQAADLRTIARILPAAGGIAVAQISAWRPLTIEKFLRSASDVRSLANSEAAAEGGAMRAFTFDRISKRLNFKPVREGEEEGAGETEAAPDRQTPAPAPAGAG